MIQSLSKNVLPLIARIGAEPDDSEESRLPKTLLVGGSLVMGGAGALWGVTYMVFGEWLAGVWHATGLKYKTQFPIRFQSQQP